MNNEGVAAEAVQLLDRCEKGLRRLVSEAAAAGDYGAIIKVTSWARALAGLLADAKNGQDSKSIESVAQNAPAPPFARPPSKRSSKKAHRSRAADSYPHFSRRGNDLIKIGWSKHERAEYQHKAPHKVLMQLVSRLTVVGAVDAMFTSDDVFPLGVEEGSPIPNYQGYLCLAWLRQEGLVKAHGRQGYTVVNGENLTSAVSSRWHQLESA